MLRLEIIRWWRSYRLLVVVLVLAASGVTAPLFEANMESILSSLGTSEVQVLDLPDPTRQSLLASYFKNSSQLGLLISCYVSAWAMSMGSDAGTRLYYRNRCRSTAVLFLPRAVVTASVMLLAGVVGSAFAVYETWVLAEDDGSRDMSYLVLALAVQIAAFVAFSVLSGVIAVWTRSAFVSTLGIAAVVLLAGLAANTDAYRWMPMSLLSPTDLLAGEDVAQTLWCLAATLVGTVLLVLLTSTRRLRHLTLVPSSTRASSPSTAGRGRHVLIKETP